MPAKNPADQRGLYEKYRVMKRSEQTRHWVRKETNSFVLSPEKDDAYGTASRVALVHYADAIEEQNPLLAFDIRKWVERIELVLRRSHEK